MVTKSDFISSWNCTTILSKSLLNTSNAVVWKKLNCTGQGWESSWVPPFEYQFVAGPMIFNTVTIDLASPSLFVQPVAADPKQLLQTLPQMAHAQLARQRKPIAAINGGYFWRVDKSSFIDDVCFFKTYGDAMLAVSATEPNYGLSDCALVIGMQAKLVREECTISIGLFLYFNFRFALALVLGLFVCFSLHSHS
jgi:hypothetical protein